MRIKMLKTWARAEGPIKEGHEITVDDKTGQQLIDSRQAVLIAEIKPIEILKQTEPVIESASIEPGETSVYPPTRRRKVEK